MIYFVECFGQIYRTQISCVTPLDYALNNSARTIHSMVTTQTLLETKLVIGAYQIITKPKLYTVVKIIKILGHITVCLFDVPIVFFFLLFLLPFVVNKDVH